MYGPWENRFPKIAIVPTSYIGLHSPPPSSYADMGNPLRWHSPGVITFLLRLKLLCEEYIGICVNI